MTYTELDDPIAKEIARRCPNLTLFACDYTYLTDDGLTYIAQNLVKLMDISCRQCVEISDDGVVALVEHAGSRLRRVNLAENRKLTDLSAMELMDCTRVHTLSFGTIGVTNTAIKEMVTE
ncbi:hypothetical protein HK097_004413, partial [Rhizophlyctis rosea]